MNNKEQEPELDKVNEYIMQDVHFSYKLTKKLAPYTYACEIIDVEVIPVLPRLNDKST